MATSPQREDNLPSVFMAELTLRHIEQYLQRNKLVLVPVGSTEQHGPHLPLSTDVLIPQEVCRRVALARSVLVAPPIPYSLSAGHKGFPALVYISIHTFTALIEEICLSLAEAGFREIVFVNGHYTNNYPIAMACLNASPKLPSGTIAFPISYWEALPPAELDEYLSMRVGLHANVGETSAVMAINPALVDLEQAVEDWPNFPPFSSNPLPAVIAFFETNAGSVHRATPSGVWGNPRVASVEKGETYLDQIERAVLKFLDDIEATYDRIGRPKTRDQ